jgi:hypothetical protein
MYMSILKSFVRTSFCKIQLWSYLDHVTVASRCYIRMLVRYDSDVIV